MSTEEKYNKKVLDMIDTLNNYVGIKYEEKEISGLTGKLNVLKRVIDGAVVVIEESPDCDNCNRERDPPDYSWRD
jgi:hypothetical protein